MDKFFNSNETYYRLLRTMVQGVIGVLIANIDLIVGTFNIDGSYKPLIVAVVMAILSPVMSMLGDKEDGEE